MSGLTEEDETLWESNPRPSDSQSYGDEGGVREEQVSNLPSCRNCSEAMAGVNILFRVQSSSVEASSRPPIVITETRMAIAGGPARVEWLREKSFEVCLPQPKESLI